MRPQETAINAKPAEWDQRIWGMWERLCSRLSWEPGYWVSYANYFSPRPYRNEYDRGWDKEGFVYTLQPGNRVCFWETIKE